MYKKYITRNGKKVGPYYYESIRLKNGKVKTIYLGRKPDKKKLKAKIEKLKLNIEEPISTGKTIIIPISAEIRLVKDAMALAEIFSNPKIKQEINEIELPEPPIPRNLEIIPTPGAKDLDLTTVIFFLFSVTYIIGFFFLQSGVTGLFAVEDLTKITNTTSFLFTLGFVNIVFALIILLKLKGGEK